MALPFGRRSTSPSSASISTLRPMFGLFETASYRLVLLIGPRMYRQARIPVTCLFSIISPIFSSPMDVPTPGR